MNPARPTVITNVRGITPQKGSTMSDTTVTNPENSSVKPGFKSTEGIMAILITLIAALTPLVGILAEKFPENPWVAVAVAAFSLVVSTLVALGYMKKRSDVKTDANQVAGRLAEVKILAELAPHLLKTVPSEPPTGK